MYYMFRPIAAIIKYIGVHNDPSFCMLYLPTLASMHTFGVRCTDMLFMYCPYVIKFIKHYNLIF
jgi:hypothetical protein